MYLDKDEYVMFARVNYAAGLLMGLRCVFPSASTAHKIGVLQEAIAALSAVLSHEKALFSQPEPEEKAT